MARLDLSNIRHIYGPPGEGEPQYALRHVNQAFEHGGAYALLGPSGCGKTTLLNIISGLVHPSEGRVRIDGVDVTDKPTEKRNIAQVFQFPVIYDTMTVRENLEFPLRNRGVAAAQIKRRVDEVIEMIGLGALARRRARGLSADEKQKVSLGRGLVREDVSAILFDEPLTVIDPEVKWTLRTQLRELQRRSGMTMIYVTHDQTEALTFASGVVVMHEGQVLQVGSPKDLFEKPAHTFVGYFIGSPGMNVLPTKVDGAALRIGEYFAPLTSEPRLRGNPKLELGIRPEFVRLAAEGIPATIERIEDIGRHRIVRTRMLGHSVTALLQEHEPIPADPHLYFEPEGVHLYADSWRVELSGKPAP
ncbi:MAG: ABC transporter ATP-binding protein [Hyphomonadaceae bacterium]|jgi:glycerol transport system ATP-binding protein|nr:ABC transporter ATP-binding protein [Hyphomonadaceae bacterium]